MTAKVKRARLISNLMEGTDASTAEGSSSADKFFVKSHNTNFSNRQQDIFGSLNALETEHAKFKDVDVDDSSDSEEEIASYSRTEKDAFPKRESVVGGVFKNPQDFPVSRPKLKPSPDFVAHPERWIKYSLADVDNSQMSDKSNTSAAMAFLNERKRLREAEEAAEKQGFEGKVSKIIFKSVASRSSKTTDSVSKVKGGSSGKWVMPEYVIGQKKDEKKSAAKEQSGDSVAGKAIILSHLEDESFVDDDDEAAKNSEKLKFKSKRKFKQAIRKREDVEKGADEAEEEND